MKMSDQDIARRIEVKGRYTELQDTDDGDIAGWLWAGATVLFVLALVMFILWQNKPHGVAW
jgi:hypothetical protein